MKRTLQLLPLASLLVAREALAQIGQASTKIPFTDYLVELFNVANGVWFPLLATIALFSGLYMINSGRGRMTENIGRIAVVIAGLGLGVSFIANAAGSNTNLSLLG